MVTLEEYAFLITSDHYKIDILNLLCLPNGVHYRFRYRKEWIPEDLESLNLAGKNGLIIFFDLNTKEFFPIRKVIVNTVETFGDVLYIGFVTGDLIYYHEKNTGKPNEYHSIIRKYIPKQFLDVPPYGLGKFVLLEKIPITEFRIGDELVCWTRILHYLWDLEPFQNSSFIKILKISSFKGETLQSNLLDEKMKERGYVLKSGETYKIEILQRTRDDFPSFLPFELRLISIEDHIMPIRSTCLIVGKYDKLEIVFHTKRQKSEILSVIGLRAPEKPMIVDLPEVYIPIKIKKELLGLILSTIFIVSGILITGFSPKIVEMSGLPSFFVAPIGLLGSTLCALGIAWLTRWRIG